MNRQNITKTLNDFDCLLMPEHENALVGIVEYSEIGPTALYDINIIIKNLMSSGMSEEQAEEFYQINILDNNTVESIGRVLPVFCRVMVDNIQKSKIKSPNKDDEKVENYNRFGKILDE